MPDLGHLVSVATDLDSRLGDHDFVTVARLDITIMIRDQSGEARTRMRPVMASELDHALLKRGILCRPTLEEDDYG